MEKYIRVVDFAPQLIDPNLAESMVRRCSPQEGEHLVFDLTGTKFASSSFFNQMFLSLRGFDWEIQGASPLQERLYKQARECL